MLSEIFEKMEPLEITNVINKPISFNEQGNTVTVGEYILQKSPQNIRRYFEKAITPSYSKILPIADLNATKLKELTLATLSRSDEDISLSFLGRGIFRKSELIKEVNSDTQIGMKVIDTVREYALFIDKLITAGKIKANLGNSIRG